jgi:hypothetical protein
MIETKEHAGTSSSGSPIIYILSKGGLHAFFSKDKDGEVTTLGTAPHRAIAVWMSEKKDPGLKWKDGFLAKSEITVDDIKKNDENRFDKLRSLIFYTQNAGLLAKNQSNDSFLIYDSDQHYIGVHSKQEILDALKKGEVSKFAVARDIGLTTSPSVLEMHPAFAEYFKENKHA